MATLIITEKSSVAEKFSQALLGSGAIKNRVGNVIYYTGKLDGKEIIIAPLAGHVYKVDYPREKVWQYPVFRKHSELQLVLDKEKKEYVDAIKEVLSKYPVTDIVAAGDLDSEGSALVGNVMRMVCGLPEDYLPKGDEKYKFWRMEFSALTPQEIRKAFNNLEPLDTNKIRAGFARAVLDLEIGANLSRGLTLAARNAGMQVRVLSSGRVQAPTIVELLKRENEIAAFKPVKYWQIIGTFEGDGKRFEAVYVDQTKKENKKIIMDKEQANKVVNECRQIGVGTLDVIKRTERRRPPPPFELGTLQRAAYTKFGMSPATTQNIANKLYHAGLCVSGDTLVCAPNGEIYDIHSFVKNRHNKVVGVRNPNLKLVPASVTNWFELPTSNLIKITFQSGAEIISTPDHKVLTIDGAHLKWKRVEEITVGDFVAMAKKIPVRRQTRASTVFELFELLPPEQKNRIRVLLSEALLHTIRRRLRANGITKREIATKFGLSIPAIHKYFWKRKARLPLNIVLWLKEKRIIFDKDLVNGITGYMLSTKENRCRKGIRREMYPIKLPYYVSPELCYTIGLFAADGSNKENQVTLAPKRKFEKVLPLLKNIFGKKVYCGKRVVTVSSSLLCCLLDVLGVPHGKKAYRIDFSNFILRQPRVSVIAFISGFFDGDGSAKSLRTGGGKSLRPRIAFTSCSRKFLEKLRLALLTFGIRAYLYNDTIRNSHDLIIYSDDANKFVRLFGKYILVRKKDLIDSVKGYTTNKRYRHSIDLLPLNVQKILPRNEFNMLPKDIKYRLGNNAKGKRVQVKLVSSICRYIKNKTLSTFSASDVMWVKVKKIEHNITNRGYVYDITTSTGAFIGNGLVLHNCSYPRTSGDKWKPAYKDKSYLVPIINKLSTYAPLKSAVEYVNKNFVWPPREGSKEDPAHPCLHPVGTPTGALDASQSKIYELVSRRFLATFCPDAVIDITTFNVMVGQHLFTTSGSVTIDKGYRTVYPVEEKEKEKELPRLESGTRVKLVNIRIEEKETTPPSRFNEASLVKLMQDLKIGTKCFAPDTMVVCSNGSSKTIETLFNEANYLTTDKEDGAEVRFHPHTTIMSFDNKRNCVVNSPFLIARRKTKDSEKLLRISTDTSSMCVTEEHPVYTYDAGRFVVKRAVEVKEGDFIINITPRVPIEGTVIVDENFLKENGFLKTGDKYVYSKYCKHFNGLPLNNLPIRWTDKLAWILGYYYGDGSYWHGQDNTHRLSFTTTANKALKILKKNIEHVFGHPPSSYITGKTKKEYKVDLNAVVARVLTTVFPQIKNKKPFNIPFEFIGSFLRGLFDADGCCYLRKKGKVRFMNNTANANGTPLVKLTLANKELIVWVNTLLNKLGIETVVDCGTAKCNGKLFKCYTIKIEGVNKINKYAMNIGFSVPYKLKKLYKGLRCKSPKYRRLKAMGHIMLSKQPIVSTLKEISHKTNCSPNTIGSIISQLIKEGVVSKETVFLRDESAKKFTGVKTKYIVKNENISHYLRLMSSKIISEDICITKVNSVETVKEQPSFVYDISVNPNIPNLLIENNILAHNSTRAPIVETLYKRGYFKNPKSIILTQLGRGVGEALLENAPRITDRRLTIELQGQLNKIENGVADYNDVIERYLKEFEQIMTEFKAKESMIGRKIAETAAKPLLERPVEKLPETCPKCGSELKVKTGRYGKFLGCANYPRCDFVQSIRRRRVPSRRAPTPKTCPKCGTRLVIRTTKYGKVLACPNFNKGCEGYIASLRKKRKYKS